MRLFGKDFEVVERVVVSCLVDVVDLHETEEDEFENRNADLGKEQATFFWRGHWKRIFAFHIESKVKLLKKIFVA